MLKRLLERMSGAAVAEAVGTKHDAAREACPIQAVIERSAIETLENLRRFGIAVFQNQYKLGVAVALEPPRTRAYPQHVFTAFSVVARYTGARIGEIAHLDAEDVVKVEGVRCLRFRTEKTRSRGGRSHDEKETRLVPVAPKLIETVDRCLAKRPSGPLFPRNGQWKWKAGHQLGKHFNDHVKRIALDLSFHCWRHYAVSEMMNAGVPREVRLEIVGHRDGSVHGCYAHATIRSKLDAISQIY